MNKFNKVIKGSVIALACAGIMGNAQADALASAVSVLVMKNFQMINTATNSAFTQGTDINVLSFFTNASTTSTLNGTSVVSNGSGIGTDLAPLCVGSCPAAVLVNNNFFSGTTTSVASSNLTSTYAVSDQYELGAPVNGLGGPLGANVGASSVVSLTGQGSGAGTADNTLNAPLQMTFQLVSSGNITFSFDALLYQATHLDASGKAGSNANTNSNFNFKLFDDTTGLSVFNWAPNSLVTGTQGSLDPFSLNDSTALSYPLNQFIQDKYVAFGPGHAKSGSFSATTLQLNNTDFYTLTADLKTQANATYVPEPGALALMGIGLVGMVSGFRRSIKV